MQDRKQWILEEMKRQRLRITNQRRVVIDVILEKNCSSCKEILYEANRIDSSIGIATVYRMVKTLEELEIIDRKDIYRIEEGEENPLNGLELELKNSKRLHLSKEDVKAALHLWLRMNVDKNIEEISNIYQMKAQPI